MGELIELGEVIVHRLVFVGEHGEGLLFQGQVAVSRTSNPAVKDR